MNISKQRSRFGRLSSWLAVVTLWLGCVACTATATTSNRISATSILEKLKNREPIQIENATIDGDLDFTALVTYPETENTRRAVVESPIFFRNCVFTGKVKAFSQQKEQTTLCDFRKNLSFVSCKFNGEANFQSITVAGTGCFSRSQFNRIASFAGARFSSEAYFDNLLFAQESHFQSVRFEKMVSFWKSIWAGAAYFQGAVFVSDAQFNLADFRANLDFSLCTSQGLLTFNYAQLTGRTIFDNCRFGNAVDFGNAVLNDASFKEAFFDTKSSFNQVKSKSISFENAFFLSQKPDLTFSTTQPVTVNKLGSRIGTTHSAPID